MARKKVLYICHNHPTVFPGGAETYALELYEGMRDALVLEPILLARRATPDSGKCRAHPGTPFSMINGDPNQYFFHTNTADFDFFYLTGRDKDLYTVHYRDFLLAHRPDIVHFQHTHFLGLDLIHETRSTLPDVPMLYTLHEYLPICHHHGQMFRTRGELCRNASPQQCHECFPEYSTQDFFLRKRYIQSQFELIDQFVAPSHYLMDRFVDWGLPQEKIVCEEYGRSAGAIEPDAEEEPRTLRNRFAFFGQLSRFKGVDLLIKAMRLLADDGIDAHLSIHGANLELQAGEFQNQMRTLLEQNEAYVTLAGSYVQTELPLRMAEVDWVVVPSIWWENSPLVIQEAFRYRKPVICSDIGGMAEKVMHDVNGLHFRAGDVRQMAATLRKAATDKSQLWHRLRSRIEPTYPMEKHVAFLQSVYDRLLAGAEVGCQ